VDACTGEQSVESLTTAFSALSSSDNASGANATQASVSGIIVKHTRPRELVVQSSLIELKTRAAHKELDWYEIYPQLYLSQTAWLHIARHARGNFSAPEKVKLGSQRMNVYARAAEEGMGKLKKVLEEVLAAVRHEGEGVPLCLVCVGGELSLHKRKNGTGKSLEESFLARFRS
jgi:hypothetical protein